MRGGLVSTLSGEVTAMLTPRSDSQGTSLVISSVIVVGALEQAPTDAATLTRARASSTAAGERVALTEVERLSGIGGSMSGHRGGGAGTGRHAA